MRDLARPVLTIALAATIVAIAGTGLAADAPAANGKEKTDLGPRVEELLAALDAATLAERSAAEKSLLEIGPAVLPHLPPPDLLPNASVRESVRRIQGTLERRRAEESIQPSKVTLDVRLPLGVVLSVIARNTGNAIEVASLSESLRLRSVTAEFDGTPFWTAIDALAKQSGARIDSLSGATALRLVAPDFPGGISDVATATSGAYRIGIESAELRPLVGNAGERMLRVKANVTAEPRLRPLFLHYAAKNVRARAGETALEPFTAAAKYETPFADGGRRIGLRWDFRVPADLGGPIGSVAIDGTVSVLTAAGTETFSFELERARGAARRKGGVTVTLLESVFRRVEGENSASIRIAVAYDTGGPAFESHRTWMFHNAAFLEDEGGKRIEREAGYSTELQADGTVVVGYTFRGVTARPADYRLVYLAPTLLIDVPVTFDIPKAPVTK